MRRRQRIGEEHIGQRVSLQWRDTDGEPTETLGYLRAVTEEVLEVERRDGDRAQVPRDRILAGRVVPTAPAPRRDQR